MKSTLLVLALFCASTYWFVPFQEHSARAHPVELAQLPLPLANEFDAHNFTEGLIKGLQKDPDTTSKCASHSTVITQMVEDVQALLEKLAKGTATIMETVTLVMHLLAMTLDVNKDCHIVELLLELAAFSNPYTMIVKIIEIVLLKGVFIVPKLVNLVIAAINMNSYNIGFNLGGIIRLVLDFSIEF